MVAQPILLSLIELRSSRSRNRLNPGKEEPCQPCSSPRCVCTSSDSVTQRLRELRGHKRSPTAQPARAKRSVEAAEACVGSAIHLHLQTAESSRTALGAVRCAQSGFALQLPKAWLASFRTPMPILQGTYPTSSHCHASPVILWSYVHAVDIAAQQSVRTPTNG